jgi:hypothetical protein
MADGLGPNPEWGSVNPLLQAAEPPTQIPGYPTDMAPLLQTALQAKMYGLGGLGLNTSANQSAGSQQSTSFIPNYSETPILESIAKQAQGMAPQVYQWGMQQYANNQGNIDTMMRNALTYASPQRIAADMGMAESGAAQGAEKGRQSALSDLQSYGIDPSAGRYAGLDQASRVMSGAATAGAGNQQRTSDIATGNAMQNQAISSSLQNVQTGYGAANAANALLGTASSLKYAPLGTQSSGSSESSGSSFGMSGGDTGKSFYRTGGIDPRTGLGFISEQHYQEGGPVGFQPGGDVPADASPSNGQQVDDVNANLNVGEFVVPKDVTAWLGQQHFYKLMAQARKARAMAGSGGAKVGYGAN